MAVTFEEAVQAVLEPLAPGGAWFEINTTEPPATDASGSAKPYIVWSVIVDVDNVSLGGASGMHSTQIQVDLFAPRAADVQALRRTVDAAFEASSLTVIPLSWQPFYEEAAKLRRIARDYSIWYDESAT